MIGKGSMVFWSFWGNSGKNAPSLISSIEGENGIVVHLPGYLCKVISSHKRVSFRSNFQNDTYAFENLGHVENMLSQVSCGLCFQEL